MTGITDPEVLAYIRKVDAFEDAGQTPPTPAQQRQAYDRMCAAFQGEGPRDVTVTDAHLSALAPARDIPIRRYCPASASSPKGTALLYLHGGGFILGGLESHDTVCAELASRCGIEVVAADYRLAPENTYPAALDDTEAVYRMLAADVGKIVVGGDSAGANLAVALCLRARRKAFAMPAGQLLIYPTLGRDMSAGSYMEHRNAPMLTRDDCVHFYALYSGKSAPDMPRDPELFPLLADNLTGLPPAAVFTADVDPLRDDGMAFCRRLRHEGIKASCMNEQQLVHGYLRARHSCARASASFDRICAALGKLAAGETVG